MLEKYLIHNRFHQNVEEFTRSDPHLAVLGAMKIQYPAELWREFAIEVPGIYILTGGRQIGKSTSCKLLIKHCLEEKIYSPKHIFYLTCDEIFDASDLSQTVRYFLDSCGDARFLLIIDEVTFVKNWDRVIKALADEGSFRRGFCLLTGSDSLILKEAAMSFPGRRGEADQVDFHQHPLTFGDYARLLFSNNLSNEELLPLFQNYLKCGGYLRAMNDLAEKGEVAQATYLTYEQWIRGDFLKKGKNEENLLQILRALIQVGVSQISYSGLTQKIGLMSKETCIDYCNLLERMDILMNLQAIDLNKKQGFPRKARKFHFVDPFIYQTVLRWLQREGYLNIVLPESTLVEACVASHCKRLGKTFYFKGQGEIDVIWLHKQQLQAIEVKWANQLRPADLKSLKHFKSATILGKNPQEGQIDSILSLPVYRFLYTLESGNLLD